MLLLSFLISFFQFVQQFDNTPIGQIERDIAFHKFWDAYEKCDNLINSDRKNVEPKVFRLKAKCALSMSMPEEAMAAASSVINNRKAPDDEKRHCYQIRSLAYIQVGDFASAANDAKNSKLRDLINQASNCLKLYQEYERRLKQNKLNESIPLLDELLKYATMAPELKLKRAQYSWDNQQFDKYSELAEFLSKAYPKDTVLAYRWSVVHMCNGQLDKASSHTKKLVNTKGSYANATSLLDTIYKISDEYKAANKNIHSNVEKAKENIRNLFKLSGEYCPNNTALIKSFYILELKIVKADNDVNKTLAFLDDILRKFPGDGALEYEKGELEMQLGEYDAAYHSFSSAARSGYSKGNEGARRAQRAKKDASKVDHYKVLNVSKTATKQEIKTAYRKAAVKWHPDLHHDAESKRVAEDMMKKVNRAYEILSDTQKRKIYDQGIDPDNPEYDQGFGNAGFNPFDLFFGGSGFSFDFGEGGGHFRQVHFGDGGFQFHFQM